MNSPKILILYASYGDGHLQASKAIESSFHARGVPHVMLLDLMAESHPVLNDLTKFIYMQSFKSLPSIYGWVYNMTKDMEAGTPFSNLLHSIGISKLEELISECSPDLIIHTFPQMVMPKLLKKTGLALPLVNVITDFDYHGRWIHPGVDRYYVATEDLRDEIVARGVPQERVLASGIPLKQGFAVQSRHDSTGDDKRTVLLMAGAFGVMHGIRQISQHLVNTGKFRVTVICGKNKDLARNLRNVFKDHPDIEIHGFVDRVQDLMFSSDCIITKPGGITLSESLACRLPLFLFRPVPGQELNNARYLKNQGVASISYHVRELVQQVQDLFENEAQQTYVLQQLDRLRRPHAADAIVTDLIEQFLTPTPACSASL